MLRLKNVSKEFGSNKAVDNISFEVEKGRIFGSVTSAEIANTLNEQGYPVEKKMIVLSDPIKSLGNYNVDIKLMSGIVAKIIVKVESL